MFSYDASEKNSAVLCALAPSLPSLLFYQQLFLHRSTTAHFHTSLKLVLSAMLKKNSAVLCALAPLRWTMRPCFLHCGPLLPPLLFYQQLFLHRSTTAH